MKIGFAGNTNNYPFILAAALQRLGCEIEFIVDRPEQLHRPEFLYDKAILQNIRIHDVADSFPKIYNYWMPSGALRRIRKVFDRCDILVVNGLWPIIARRSGRPYLNLLTGSDLEVYADVINATKTYWKQSTQSGVIRRLANLASIALASQQLRSGISGADIVSYFPKGLIENGDRILGELLRPDTTRISTLMTDTRKLSVMPLPAGAVPKVLLGARLTWCQPRKPGTVALDYKGSDVFLRGVAMFRRLHKFPIQVTLVRKGLDVAPTEALVADLGLQDSIVWKSEMSQAQFYEECARSDVIADQFGSSAVGMAGLDAMAMGRPLLADGRPDIFYPVIGEHSPICQANTDQQVCAQLVRLYDPRVRQEVGMASRAYVERHFSADAVARRCLELFKSVTEA